MSGGRWWSGWADRGTDGCVAIGKGLFPEEASRSRVDCPRGDKKRAVPRLESGTALGSCYSMSRIISWCSPVCSRVCCNLCHKEPVCGKACCSWLVDCSRACCKLCHREPVCDKACCSCVDCGRVCCNLCCREPDYGRACCSWLCTLCRCSWYTCKSGNFLYTLCICNRCICTLSYCIPFCSTRFSLCCRSCFEQQPVKR